MDGFSPFYSGGTCYRTPVASESSCLSANIRPILDYGSVVI